MLLSSLRSVLIPSCILPLGLALWGCDAVNGSEAEAALASASISTDEAVEGAGSDYWDHLSDEEFWDHVAALDSTVNVGLKMPGQRRGVDESGQSQIPRGLWGQLTRKAEQTGAVLLASDDLHPPPHSTTDGPDQVSALRRSPFTEFVEPASFGDEGVQPFSGCDDGKKRDYEQENTIYPGDVYPYSLTGLTSMTRGGGRLERA